MKKYLMMFGAGILLVLVGAYLKIEHLAAADVVLIAGLLLELVSFILLAKTVFVNRTRKSH